METRGRKLGRRQDSSRDSSVSSTSREVRCGCQYFQTDSLLPERHNLVGLGLGSRSRPSSRNRNMGDHEYEVVNPPASAPTSPLATRQASPTLSPRPASPTLAPRPASPTLAPRPASPPLLTVTNQEGQETITESEKLQSDFKPFEIIERSKHQYLRIPLDRDEILPLDKAEVESLRYDDEEEELEQNAHEVTAQEIQDQMEERFFAATPTTTISRTDGEFNTSQMDSSGLDELPLKKDARRGFSAKGFQHRVQSQAGRIRSRIRNMSRPKFNLPDRPKLHLPERPKFNFPERPKFNIKRPDFNIKRPDIKMPNFNFGKTKSSSLRRPLRERSNIPSNQSTVGSKKNIFDSINFRTYPRIFSKKKKVVPGRRAMTPPPRMETESTPPSSPASRADPLSQRWAHRFKDIKFADDDNQSDLKKPSFDDDIEDDSAPFHEPDLKAALTLTETNENRKKQMKAESSGSIPGSDREQHSSGSSSERHRAGVIEEIDSDEFFLREKGISREDVDVSRYLSLEIRDAFRSPKNALASLDREAYDEDNEDYNLRPQRATGEPIRLSMEAIRNQSLEKIRMTPEHEADYHFEDEEEPVRPERTRSLKKRSKTRSESEEPKAEQELDFNTFPPNRPTRPRKQSSQSKHSIPLDDYNEANKENRQDQIQSSVPSLAITDTTKELSPTRYIDESSEALEPWMVEPEPQPPLPPKRRKSMRESSQDNESLSAHQFNRGQWLEDEHHEDIVLDHATAHQRGIEDRLVQNGYYDTPPHKPVRKSRSRGTSLADEDRTSRGADSLVSESRTNMTEDLSVDFRQGIKAFTPDYAVIERTVIEVTPKSDTLEKPKPIRPPPPSRKKKTTAHLAALKNQSINFFFTYPRRAIKKSLHRQQPTPVRPLRNYSSIGPPRPPRRNRVFREPVYEGEYIPLKDENETNNQNNEFKNELFESEHFNSILHEPEDEKLMARSDQEDEQDIRDLQSGDVIKKMKGRPLPPPPRPPRKTKEDFPYTDDEADRDLELDAEVTDLDAEEEDVVVSERLDILISHQHPLEIKKEKILHSQHVEADDERPIEEICDWEEQFETEENLVPSEQEYEPEHGPEPIQEPPVKAERRKKSLSVAKRAATPVVPDEATVSTQTDSLPEGSYVDEEQQTIGDYSKFDQTSTNKFKADKEKEVEKKVETIIEHKVVVIPTPETEILKAKKIHVSELEVETLNVAELQAKKITVSDIDGVSMQVTEITSKSGNLIVSGIELPASFLEAITPPQPPAPIIQVQSSSQTPPETKDSETNTTPPRENSPPARTVILQATETKSRAEENLSKKPNVEEFCPKTQNKQETTARPLDMESTQKSLDKEIAPQPSATKETTVTPPPSPIPCPPPQQKRPSPPPAIIIQCPRGQSSTAYVPGFIPSSPPPRSRSHGRDSEEELRMLPRRRRHHSHKQTTQYTSDEEDEEEYPAFPLVRRPPQREVTSAELIRQLLNIWQASTMRGVNSVVDGLNAAFPEGEKRKDVQTAACIILVLIAGLIMLGFGQDKTVHHHHWDFLPPHP